MSDAPCYRIETIADFLKVPRARRQACLKEFAAFLALAELAQHEARAVGLALAPESFAFTWIDDNQGTATVTVHPPAGMDLEPATTTIDLPAVFSAAARS